MRLNKIISTMALLIVVTLGVSVLAVQPADAAFKIRFSASGDLTVTGDNNADHVEIRSVDSTTWEVTVSNGATSTTRQYTEAPRNITVNTRGGQDVVIVENLGRPINNLTVNTGGGGNQVDLSLLDVGGKLKIIDGSAGSEYSVSGIRVGRQSTINLGKGHDFFTGSGNSWEGKVKVTSADRVDLTGITEAFLGGLDVRGGSGRDLIAYRSDTAFINKPVKINTSGGNDLVLFKEFVHISAPTTIRLGGGADEAMLLLVQGNDRLSVFGDGGNDLFNLSAGTFDERVTLNGGGNNDSLVGEANTFADPPRIVAIENVG